MTRSDKAFFVLVAKILIVLTLILYPFGMLNLLADELKIYVLTGSGLFALYIFYWIAYRYEAKHTGAYDTRYPWRGRLLFVLLFAFVVWSTLTLAWSEDRMSTISGLIKLWFMFLFAFSVKELFKRFCTEGLGQSILFGTCVSLFISSSLIYYKLYAEYGLTKLDKLFKAKLVASGDPSYSTYVYKVFMTTPFGNSHNITLSIMASWIGIALIMYYSFPVFKRAKSLTVFSIAYSLPIYYLGISKSAFIGLGVIFILLFMASLLIRNLSLTRAFAVIVVFNLLILAANPLHIREGTMARFGFSAISYEVAKEKAAQPAQPAKPAQPAPTPSQPKQPAKPAAPKDNSISGRYTLATVALNKFRENPIVGNGYRALIKDYMSLKTDKNDNPHNIYLQVLSESGIIGFLILGAFFILMVIETIRIRSRILLLLWALIISYMVRGLFMLQFIEMDIWLSLSLFIAVVEMNQERTELPINV